MANIYYVSFSVYRASMQGSVARSWDYKVRWSPCSQDISQREMSKQVTRAQGTWRRIGGKESLECIAENDARDFECPKNRIKQLQGTYSFSGCSKLCLKFCSKSWTFLMLRIIITKNFKMPSLCGRHGSSDLHTYNKWCNPCSNRNPKR